MNDASKILLISLINGSGVIVFTDTETSKQTNSETGIQSHKHTLLKRIASHYTTLCGWYKRDIQWLEEIQVVRSSASTELRPSDLSSLIIVTASGFNARSILLHCYLILVICVSFQLAIL